MYHVNLQIFLSSFLIPVVTQLPLFLYSSPSSLLSLSLSLSLFVIFPLSFLLSLSLSLKYFDCEFFFYRQEKALLLSVEKGFDDFTASNGWLDSWRKRHNVKFTALSGKQIFN